MSDSERIVSEDEIRADMHVQWAEEEIRELMSDDSEVVFTEQFRDRYAHLAHMRLRAALRIRKEKLA